MVAVVTVAAPAPLRKTRAELMKDIDAFYYGYGDEDDGVIVPLEVEAEKEGQTRGPTIRCCVPEFMSNLIH